MIIICSHFIEVKTDWESVTAIATSILAIFTIGLVIAAIIQLLDIKKFIKQNENLNHEQSAENIIIKQIEFHHQIVERIEANKKDAFRTIYESLKGFYGFGNIKSPKKDVQIRAAYDKIYADYGYLLGHYYRNLYRIFKKIDEIKIESFDKKHYAKLVRAQLSEFEVLLLFYNCIWIEDDYKFKKLVEKYELLEGLNYSRLLKRDHSDLFSKTSFGVDLL